MDDLATLQTMALSRTFTEHTHKVNAMGYSHAGEFLVTSSEDNTIRLFDAIQGVPRAGFNLANYGCDFAQFCSGNQHVIHASRNGENHDVRVLDMHTQQYTGFYEGHTDRVTSVSVKPDPSDAGGLCFSTAAFDRTVRFYTYSYNAPLAVIPNLAPGRIVTSYDPTSPVLAIADSSRRVHLYDTRSLVQGPFARLSFTAHFHSAEQVTTMSFSCDGKQILVGSVQNTLLVFDTFEGNLLHKLDPHARHATEGVSDVHPNMKGFMSIFSPSGSHVLRGSRAGTVHTWKIRGASSGQFSQPVLVEPGNPTNCLAWNPQYCQLAVASTKVFFYMPSEKT